MTSFSKVILFISVLWFLVHATNATLAQSTAGQSFATIYESDFSTNPNWQTPDPDNFYWSSSSSAQFARAYSQRGDRPGRHFVTETTLDPTKSFVLEADIYIEEFSRSSGVVFGLFSEDFRMANQNRVNGVRSLGTTNIHLHSLDGMTNNSRMGLVDRNRNNLGGGGSSGIFYETDVWYTFKIEYDAETGSVFAEVMDKETEESLFVFDRSDAGIELNPNMRFLGVAMEPQGLPNTTFGDSRTDVNDHSEFLIDNVRLQQAVENAEPTISNLGQARLFDGGIIDPGATFIGNAAVFTAEVLTQNGGGAQLEVEVVSVDDDFTGDVTHLSEIATSGEVVAVTVEELIDTPELVTGEGVTTEFKWRARALDSSGLASPWQEFGADDNADFITEYTVGLRASEYARELLVEVAEQQALPSDVYELGSRGWDYLDGLFASAAAIVSGYNQRNYFSGFTGVAPGIDCSGLIYWAFNKSVDPETADGNYVANITADGMFRDIQSDPVSEEDLQPGDALFFNFGGGARINHVAMYVGESSGFDVVNAGSEDTGVTEELNQIFGNFSDFVSYRHIRQQSIEGVVRAGSPVDLIITDPEGNTLSFTDTVLSDLEQIREVPGELYYSEIAQGHDGNPADVVYIADVKSGSYIIEVVPNTDASPNETYSLSFAVDDTVVQIVEDEPISSIPVSGFVVQVDDDGTPSLDITPPEAVIRFSLEGGTNVIEGVDESGNVSVLNSGGVSTLTDDAGNTLEITTTQRAKKVTQVMKVKKLDYSSGITADTKAVLRSFHRTHPKNGRLLKLAVHIKTQSERLLAIYNPKKDVTRIITLRAEDDEADMEMLVESDTKHKKVKKRDGLVLPQLRTKAGEVIVEY